MPHTVASVIAVAERLWPGAGAEAWDTVGLVSGNRTAPVKKILLSVDAVSETVDEAIALGCDLLIAHHPLLLRGVSFLAEDTSKGAVIARLIRNNCALFAAHTNADVVETGTSATLAGALGLTDLRAIVSSPGPAGVTSNGLGRVGMLQTPVALGALARELAKLLPATAGGVRVAGEYSTLVSTIALCAGAGDSLLNHPEVMAADVFITADLRHHPVLEARESARAGVGPAIVDVSHWASEWLWLANAADELRSALPGVTVTVSDLRTDPWDFVVVQ